MLLRAKMLIIAMLMAAVIGSSAAADITLPSIFSDHMVLQQNSTPKIWGTAEPGQELTISFNEQEMKVKADANGNWETKVKTGGAGGPYQLQIAGADSKIIYDDVMIGEVWICSGQSNMEWPISKSLNPEIEIAKAKDYPNIRLFTVQHNASPTPLTEFSKAIPWSKCSPETIGDFSATAYFFGRKLNKDLNVPIGLIHVAWGGTRCEAWTEPSALKDIPIVEPLLEHWETADEPNSQHRPGNLFNGMISPLKNVNSSGVIWYQGEANVGRGKQYQSLLPALIKNWRTHLGNDQLPFLIVQLAPYRYETKEPEALAELWDAQLKTHRRVPGTGLVVTHDIGDVKNIHPKNKQEVGRRLALWALAKQYNKRLPEEEQEFVYCGPLYESLSVLENKAIITFDHSDGGLKSRDDVALTGFTVCGEDKVFHPAVATIMGDRVELVSDKVLVPVAVRFGWDDSAELNLVNDAGLPASPFRTDDFELLSEENFFN